MKVAIRTDASPTIGTGHLMRCLTLADALRADGAEVSFLCAPPAQRWSGLVEARGHRVMPLGVKGDGPGDGDLHHSSWLPWGQAADAEVAARSLGNGVDWVIVDHYGLDARWEARMSAVAGKVMAIDDLADRRHDCDMLVDHNAQAPGRYDGVVASVRVRLIGPMYALLRPAFAVARERCGARTGNVHRIAVFMSGTDPDGTTVLALAALSRSDVARIPVDVAIGAGSPHRVAIERAANAHGGAVVHIDAPDLADLFANADLAIGAGGVAALERCCVGLPTITMTLAANQAPALAELSRVGAVKHLGDHAGVSEQRLYEAVSALVVDPERVAAISASAARVTDGKGVRRVVDAMQAA